MADIFEIAGRIHSTSQEGVATVATEVLDETQNKKQSEVNVDVARHENEIHGTGGIDSRLSDVEQLAEISIGGGDAQIATGADFTNPDATKRAKVPTVGAIVDGLNDGVYDVSKRNPTSGPNSDGKFTLEYILSNANTLIPTSWRHGGMTISFVDSSDNKYIQYRLMSDAWSVDIEDWVIAEEGVYVENPEFVYVKADAEGKILWAIKTDGGIYYGAGVPQQVIDYIEEKIADLSLDEYEDIVAFLDGLEREDITLRILLNAKVDKEEGKSLIDAEYAASQSVIDNPEWIDVKTDSEDKVLEGIKSDGTKVITTDTEIGGNIKVVGKAEISGASYSLIESPEWIKVLVDNENRIIVGIRTDGSVFLNSLDKIPDIIQEILDNLTDVDISLSERIAAFEQVFSIEQNPEYIAVETDAEGKILAARTTDGNKIEKLGLSVKGNLSTDGSFNINGTKTENIEDSEDRIEIKTDSEEKVLSYRDSNGVLHENIGIETSSIKTNTLTLSKEGINKLRETEEAAGDKIKKYNLPHNGTVNLLSETFYLTSNSGYSDKNGVYPIQVFENNLVNAQAQRVCQVYYVKNSLVDNGDGTYSLFNDGVEGHDIALNFYAASKVTKLNNQYYVTSTLTEIIDPITGDVSYVVNAESIEVTQIIDTPNFQAWPIDKDIEHRCVVDIDFGDYLKDTYYIGVKFQGASTLRLPKRNLRFTFYKNGTYKKKLKIKIGDFVRLSGFNLKAYYVDATRQKEYILNRLFQAIWEYRADSELYPWNSKEGYYTGATGIINAFYVKVNIAGNFWGLFAFGLKKDEKNYMLDGDDDGSGIFASNNGHGWETTTSRNWSDEMGVDGRELAYPDMGDDSLSIESATALDRFLDFVRNRLHVDASGNIYALKELTKVNDIYYVTSTLQDNGDSTYSVIQNSVAADDIVEFNRANAHRYMSVISFIDYMICIQSFHLDDDVAHNMIFYSGSDKEKFYVFPYDLDSSFNAITGDVLDYEVIERPILFDNMIDVFWDDIYNRYIELRKHMLNTEYIRSLCDSVSEDVPSEWFNLEQSMWGSGNTSFAQTLSNQSLRFDWLDKNYFISNK